MNPLYEKSKDLILIRRTSDNKEFEEYPLIVQPQSALVTDPSNDVICFSLCALRVGFATSASYSETSSFAHTASHAFLAETSSWAWFALSASFSNSGSYVFSSSHALWTDTASFALEASAAFSAAYASNAVSASYAFSASYAESASYGTNFYAPRVTSSYVSASVAMQTNQLTASTILARGGLVGTASYATNAFTSLYSVSATNADTATLAVNALTASVATSSISASHALTASYVATASFAMDAYNVVHKSGAEYIVGVKTFGNNIAGDGGWTLNNGSGRLESNGVIVIGNAAPNTSISPQAGYQGIQVQGSIEVYNNDVTASHFLGNLVGTASYASFAALASSSIGTRGLNVVNVPPMPNANIGWTVPSSTPAVYDAIATIGPSPAEGQTHAFIHLPDSNKIYGGGWYGTIYVFNDPDNDFTNITSCSFNAGSGISAVVYASGSLYFINGSNIAPSTGSITRVNVNNITSQSIIVQGLSGYPALPPLVTDGNYLYTLVNNAIQKYDLSGSLVSSVASVSASVTVAAAHAGTISDDYQWAYFSTTNGTIFKVNTSNLSNYTASGHIQSNFPNCCFNASLQDDMCYLNGYLYHSVESNGNVFKINATDLSYTAYPASFNSFGVFTDGTHVYALMGNEIWVYLNGDMDSGPIRFGVTGTANEFAITNGGRVVYSNWTTLNLYSYFLPITQLGINKQPQYALDVAGVANIGGGVLTSTVSASTSVSTNTLNTVNETLYGTFTLQPSGIIRASNLTGSRITPSTVRSIELSSSVATLGRVTNLQFSQSFMAGDIMAYTRSLGTITNEGMYRLTIAGTIGFYSGSTLQNQPKWQFLHTDRMGAYLLPQTPLTPITLTAPPNYDYAFSFGTDYVFQAVAGSTVEYYYQSNGAQVSSTDCSASFFTSATLTQIMSGSVTSSLL